MPAGFTSSDQRNLIAAEREVRDRLGELGVDHDVDLVSLAAVSNIFRAATMVRGHMERTVLADANLSFTAFTVLWVLWIWGEQEARYVADEAGISRSTLTGVLKTLEGRGLAHRRAHPTDRRSVLVSAAADGEALMAELFPRFNDEESKVSAALAADSKNDLAAALRTIVRTVGQLDR